MKKSLLLTLVLTPILAIACTKPAVAGVTINPVEVILGYEYNDVTEGQDAVDSLRAEIGTVSKVGHADVSYGLTTLVNDSSLRSYGAYAGNSNVVFAVVVCISNISGFGAVPPPLCIAAILATKVSFVSVASVSTPFSVMAAATSVLKLLP